MSFSDLFSGFDSFQIIAPLQLPSKLPSHRTNIPSLPVELYNQILHTPLITKRELLNLCLTSWTMFKLASPLLYRLMDFKEPVTSKLAIRTLIISDEQCKHVRTVIVRVSTEMELWIKDNSQPFANVINRLQNLYEFFIYQLEAQLNDHFVQIIMPWIHLLNLSSIQTLRLSGIKLLGPLRSLFHGLNSPLRHFITQNYLFWEQLEEVEHVRCEGFLRGGEKLLPRLKSLELRRHPNGPVFQTFSDHAPNLQTLALMPPLIEIWSFWFDQIPKLPRLRGLGLVRVDVINEVRTERII